MKKILDFLTKNVNLVLLVIIGALIFMYSLERKGKKDLNDNIIVMKDSVEYHRNKAKELYAQVNTYVITEKQLKEANEELYDEVNKLKGQKPIVVVKEKVKVVYKDTTLVSSISEKLDKDGNKLFNVPWSKDTTLNKGNYIKLFGSSHVKIDSTLKVLGYGSRLDRFELGTNLFLSVTENKKGGLLINARSDFPGLTFTEIEGYVIDPSQIKQFKQLYPKKRYGVSFFGGVGTFMNGGAIQFMPTVGVGITYDLIRF